MAECGCTECGTATDGNEPGYRRILLAALVLNAAMAGVECAVGLWAGSMAVEADALDFLGDAANFAIGLLALGWSPRGRANAALVKGLCMGAFGLWVLGNTAWHAWAGTLPRAEAMSGIGLLALAVNGLIAALLYSHRGGDANRLSVWLCARNDAIANGAVILAALGVSLTATHWPDILVAALIGGLNLGGAASIAWRATRERRAIPLAVPA